SGLSMLGAQTAQPTSPETAVLERVPNPHADTLYLARFTAPEFTSLCPVTGQPDFAHIVIDYAPGEWLVESKSLKLYLTSFRNHGAFHEDCTVAIGKRLAELLQPKWLRIGGYWYPRGGIPIDGFWQTGPAPEGQWLPDQGVWTYRGRGGGRSITRERNSAAAANDPRRPRRPSLTARSRRSAGAAPGPRDPHAYPAEQRTPSGDRQPDPEGAAATLGP